MQKLTLFRKKLNAAVHNKESEKLPIIKYFSKKSIFFVKYLMRKINLHATNRT
jgi:hypothetical protein